MKKELEEISNLSDVGYLLLRLKLAKRRKENEIIRAILNRLMRMGVLKHQQEIGETLAEPFKNLRVGINKILERDADLDQMLMASEKNGPL